MKHRNRWPDRRGGLCRFITACLMSIFILHRSTTRASPVLWRPLEEAAGEYALEEALAAASVPLPDSQVEVPILDSTECYQELEAGFNLKNYEDGGDSNPPSVEYSESCAALQSELFELGQRGFIDVEPVSVDDLQSDHTSQPSVDEPAVLAVPIDIPVEESLALPTTGYYIPASQNPLFIGEAAADEVGEQSAVAFVIGDNAPTGEVAVIDEPAAVAVSAPADYVPANQLVETREPRSIATPVSADYIPAEEVLVMGEPQREYDPSEEAPIMGQPTAVAVPDHGNYVPAVELLSMDDPGDCISQELGPMNESQVSMPLFVEQVAGPSRSLRAHAVQLYQRGGVGEPHTCFITSFPRVNVEPDETPAHAGPMAAASRATNMVDNMLGPGEEDEREVQQTATSLLPTEGRLDTIAEALRCAAISFTGIAMEDVEACAMQREPASSGSEYASAGSAPTADYYIVNDMPNNVPENEVIPGTPEITTDDDMNENVNIDGCIPSDISNNREIETLDNNAVMNNSPTKKDADTGVTTTNKNPDVIAASVNNVAVVAADTDREPTAATPPLEMDAAADESTYDKPAPFDTVFAANELVVDVVAADTVRDPTAATPPLEMNPETTPTENVSNTVSAADETTSDPETTPFETVSAAEESTVSTTNIEAVSVGIVSTAATMLLMKSSAVAAEAMCNDTSTKIKAKPDDSSVVEPAISSNSAVKDDPPSSRKSNKRKRAAKPKGKTGDGNKKQNIHNMILRSFRHK